MFCWYRRRYIEIHLARSACLTELRKNTPTWLIDFDCPNCLVPLHVSAAEQVCFLSSSMVMTVSALPVVVFPHLGSIVLLYFLGSHPFPNPMLLLFYLYSRVLLI